MRTKKPIVTEKRLDKNRPYGISQAKGREDFYLQDGLLFDKTTLREIDRPKEFNGVQ
jgi:hypothetical protein